MGLKMRSLELEGMGKWARYLLRSLTGQAGPNISEKITSIRHPYEVVVLAFENLNDHETLMKENIVPPNYGDLIKPKILLEEHLTPSINGLSVGEGTPVMVYMSPFSTVNSRVYDARGVRLFNEVLQIQGNMAGQAQEWTSLAAKHFYLRKARRYTTVIVTAFEERTVDCIVDCLSASALNPLVRNSGARTRNQSGIYLKSNRKYRKKMWGARKA